MRPRRSDSDWVALRKVIDPTERTTAEYWWIGCAIGGLELYVFGLFADARLVIFCRLTAALWGIAYVAWCIYSRSIRTIWSALVLTPLPIIGIWLFRMVRAGYREVFGEEPESE